jgi:hypothetical protein
MSEPTAPDRAQVTWEATLAEVVDAHVRAFGRTPRGRRAQWLIPAGFGLAVGVFIALVRPAPLPVRLLWGGLWASFSAVVFITMFRRALKRRLHQHLAAQLGTEPRMAYRLEVDGEGVHARQGTFDRRYHWDEVLEVEEGARGPTLYFADGFFAAVPSRAFADDAARQAFTEVVRAHHGA